MKEFKERLELFIKRQYCLGQTRFEDYCGLAHGTISAIKSNGPSASVVTRIAVKCPELNLNWLFRGDGEMVIGGEDAPAEAKSSPSVSVRNVQAVFVTNWNDIRGVVEDAIKNSLR